MKMHFKNIDLRHLMALDALLREAHVTRAAERLSITQPAVSNSLSRLRDHFGDELLVRSGSQLVRTPFAERLQERLNQTLLDLHSITAMRPEFEPGTSDRTFEISMPEHLAGLILPKIIGEIDQFAPDVRVQYLPPSESIYTRFGQGELDVMVTPQGMADPLHPAREVRREPWVIIAAGAQESLTARLKAHDNRLRFVIPTAGRGSDVTVHAQALGEIVAVATVPTLPYIVAGTELCAIVPRSHALFHAGQLGLAIADLPGGSFESIWVMQWHARHSNDAGGKWFRKLVQGACAPRPDYQRP